LFADAHVYMGLFIDVRVEESSQRAIFRTDPEKTKDGVPVIDEIRTDRIDSPLGARIYRLLQQCRPGDQMLVWRVNEPMRTDKMKNVRVAYHVKRLRRAAEPPQTSARPEQHSPARPAERSSQEEAPTPPATERDQRAEEWGEELSARFAALRPASRQVIVARTCRAEGLDDWMKPSTITTYNRVLGLIVEQEQEQEVDRG
jgi:hypothetical protein